MQAAPPRISLQRFGGPILKFDTSCRPCSIIEPPFVSYSMMLERPSHRSRVDVPSDSTDAPPKGMEICVANEEDTYAEPVPQGLYAQYVQAQTMQTTRDASCPPPPPTTLGTVVSADVLADDARGDSRTRTPRVRLRRTGGRRVAAATRLPPGRGNGHSIERSGDGSKQCILSPYQSRDSHTIHVSGGRITGEKKSGLLKNSGSVSAGL